MSIAARAYLYSIILAGFTVIACSITTFHLKNVPMLMTYMVLTILSSGLKVSLPGVTGTMSVWFLFILIGFTELSVAETLVLGCSAALVQCFWHAKKRPSPIQVLFNVGAVALAIFVGFTTYHSPLWQRFGVGFPATLGIAAAFFFVGNTGFVSVVIALTENKSAMTVWRECYLWCFPYYLLGASIAALFGFLTERFGWEVVVMTIPLIVFMFRSYTTYLGRLRAEKEHAEKMAALHLRTIEALALAIEAKDETTHSHLRRVKVYALAIGKEMDLGQLELDALEAAALLHDIGKLAVPEHILSKPGKLTVEEFEKMKIHPVVGAEILDRVEFPYPVARIVRAHHEKWDGSGYPYGLAGEDIPIGARILAAVDCLDALASDRPYRPRVPVPEAMQMVADLSGIAFDPKVVEILKRRYLELEDEARSNGGAKELPKLSTKMKIERGEAPAAGFEDGRGAAVLGKGPSMDFLTSIAAARQEAQELFELAKDLGNSLSLHETLLMFSARVKKMVPFDSICLFLTEGESLKAAFANGENALALSSLNVPLGEGIAGWVAANRQPILNGNPEVEPGYRNPAGGFEKLSAALAVPLEGLDQVVGVLALYSVEADAFSRDQLRILHAISQKIAAAIENALKYEKVKKDATIDHLTSLPNAGALFMHLEKEVSRCNREAVTLSVLVCDLDGFKQVNDRFGHLVGNQLLREIAIQFKSSCRGYDYVARMGGDEFVLVFPGIEPTALSHRMVLLDRIAIDTGQSVCGERVISLSVGHAFLGANTADAAELLAEADRQMYRAKQRRKSSRLISPDALQAGLGSQLVQ